MTAALVIEGVVIVVLLGLLAAVLHWQSSERERREAAITAERAELLSRIQAPERLPLPAQTFVIPDLEEDESAVVGTIAYDERYGSEDE